MNRNGPAHALADNEQRQAVRNTRLEERDGFGNIGNDAFLTRPLSARRGGAEAALVVSETGKAAFHQLGRDVVEGAGIIAAAMQQQYRRARRCLWKP